MNIIRVSNSLDPGQDRHSAGPDFGQNCLQRLSADDKSHHQQGKSKTWPFGYFQYKDSILYKVFAL